MSSAEESASSSGDFLSPLHEVQAIYKEIASVATSIGQKALKLADECERVELNAREELPPLETLTPKERETLELISSGMTNAEAARSLWVTEQTVKFHLCNVYKKLGVRNRTEASGVFRGVAVTDINPE